MYHRSLAFNDQALVDFAFSLWRNLDYVKGSQRVQRYLADRARAVAELQAKQAQAKREQEQQAAALAATKEQKQPAEEIRCAPVPKPVSNRRRVTRRRKTTSRAQLCNTTTTSNG